MYTRSQWATSLLFAIGNTNPSQQTLEWLVAWTLFETTGTGGAAYNLLNTTEPNTPGVVSNFNSVGVKNYDTFTHGVQANAKVLQNGYYNHILAGLKTNNITLLENDVNINHELSIWGTGGVQQNINARVGQGMKDSFPGSSPAPAPAPVPTPGELALWTHYIPDLRYGTGISESWKSNAQVYMSPLTPEQVVLSGSKLVVQEFEHATCFWINGTAHWREYR